MSLRLYLDDCAFSHQLLRLLTDAGHNVQTPADVRPSLVGAEDAAHFAHAKANRRAILTLNPRDFKELHDRSPDHCGVLAIYQDNDPSKDMSWRDVVRAIANLESMITSVEGQFIILNIYRW